MKLDDTTRELIEEMCNIVAQVAAMQLDDDAGESLYQLIRQVAATFEIPYSETTVTENADGSITVAQEPVEDQEPQVSEDPDVTFH